MPTTDQVQTISRLASLWNFKLGTAPVCKGHSAPAYILAQAIHDRPSIQVTHAPRGGGKSAMSALQIHLNAITQPKHNFRILGGSVAQSLQIYSALKSIEAARPDDSLFLYLNKTQAKYKHGPEVVMLAAAETSVRGDHVQSLFLDEVDQIIDEIRESAYGMAMELHGIRSSIVMTSTWNRVSGPMSRVMQNAKKKGNPCHTFCAFDVLERCPDERSGPNLEHCPDCPLVQWCHADRADDPLHRPKAKRSSGHYSIDGLIQKVELMSQRGLESDFLCLEPMAPGAWFSQFSRARHVSESAEYVRDRPFHVSIDGGLHCGAVWFQWVHSRDGSIDVNVFDSYYAYDLPGGAEAHGKAIKERTRERTGLDTRHPQAKVSCDPAAGQKNPLGIIVLNEFERSGCVNSRGTLDRWPATGQYRPKTDGLAFLEALVMSASGKISLKIHPRAEGMIEAMQSYRRKEKGDTFVDEPVDPQHPAEEHVDSLVGGLVSDFPEGRSRPVIGKEMRVGMGM